MLWASILVGNPVADLESRRSTIRWPSEQDPLGVDHVLAG